MKVIAVHLLFFLTIGAFGQNNTPVIGYDRFQWGTSTKSLVETLQSAYEQTPTKLKNSNIGVRLFFTEKNEPGIVGKNFYFFQDKLYKVTIMHDVRYEKININEIINKVMNVYGKAMYHEDVGGGIDNYLIRENLCVWKYSKDLKIEIRWGNVLAYDFFNIGPFIISEYKNPETEAEIEIAKIRLNQESNSDRTFTVPVRQ